MRDKLKEDYMKSLNDFKDDLLAEYETKTAAIRSKYSEKRNAEEKHWKQNQELNIEAIKAEERARIDTANSAVDTEFSILAELKRSLEQKEENLENDLKKEFKNRVADYKKELEEMNKLKRANEINSNYLKKKAAIVNKYENMVEDIKRQYDNELEECKRLPSNTVNESKHEEYLTNEFKKRLQEEEEKLREDDGVRVAQEQVKCDLSHKRKINSLGEEHDSALKKLIEQEVKKTKLEEEAMQELVKEKEAELKRILRINRELLDRIEEMSKEMDFATSQPKDNAADYEVEELRLELKAKEEELAECARTVESTSERGLHLDKLEQDIKSIKKGLLSAQQKKEELRRQKSLKLELDKIKNILKKPSEINANTELSCAQSKLQEILSFIANEGRELQSTRADTKAGYELLLKLMQNLESQRRECGKDLATHTFDKARRIALKSVKDKYDSQVILMMKELNKAKEKMIRSEKRMAHLGMMENVMKASRGMGVEEYLEAAKKVEGEYERYVERYSVEKQADTSTVSESVTSTEQPIDNKETLPECKEMLDEIKEILNSDSSERKRVKTARTATDTTNYFTTQRFLKTNDKFSNIFTPKATNVFGLFKDETNWLRTVRSSIGKIKYL
eukprot:TRINITY_DN4781_c0_g2_i8.p1 TRINITY_DN4781_c0_g2~~TRINITY_DN4781_c0_g2_i8.p1  ORF type:complete len:623 (-),score=157.54 TRINITY_DN4781_c0_g2_i8:130-1998(-)